MVVTPGRSGWNQNVISTSHVPHIEVRRACSGLASGLLDSVLDRAGGPALAVVVPPIALTATSAAIKQECGRFIGRQFLDCGRTLP